jgi:hypothetical protein
MLSLLLCLDLGLALLKTVHTALCVHTDKALGDVQCGCLLSPVLNQPVKKVQVCQNLILLPFISFSTKILNSGPHAW